MFSISRVSLLLCLLIITVGCQKGADPSSEKQSSAPTNESAKTDSKETTSSKTETASKSADKEDPKSEEPKPPELPKTVTGNWVLMLPRQQQMMPLYLLKITAPETPKSDEKKPAEKPTAQAVELLAKGADVAPAKILSSKATELTVDFDESLLNDGKEFLRFNFQGKLKNLDTESNLRTLSKLEE